MASLLGAWENGELGILPFTSALFQTTTLLDNFAFVKETFPYLSTKLFCKTLPLMLHGEFRGYRLRLLPFFTLLHVHRGLIPEAYSVSIGTEIKFPRRLGDGDSSV